MTQSSALAPVLFVTVVGIMMVGFVVGVAQGWDAPPPAEPAWPALREPVAGVVSNRPAAAGPTPASLTAPVVPAVLGPMSTTEEAEEDELDVLDTSPCEQPEDGPCIGGALCCEHMAVISRRH